MAWNERQRRMLAEMGLRVWAPEAGAEAAVEVDEHPAVVVPGSASQAESDAGVDVGATARLEAGEGLRAVPGSVPGTRRDEAVTQAGSTPAARAPAVPAQPAETIARIVPAEWTALRAAVAECRACRLCDSRRNTVFGVGDEHAHLMVIGEAPGEQEDLQGEPFVGPAGQLLDAMLRAIGFTRQDAPPQQRVFIANTLKCRPPNNRNPQPDELAACEPFLQQQIALVQPKVILAMGRFAVQALLRSSEPVGKLRGRVHTYQGVPLVVTYHPAYLLRNLPDKARAWDDLCVVAELLAEQSGG